MVDFFMTGGLVNLLSTACVRKVDYPGHAHMRFYSQLHLLLIALDTKMPRRQQQKFLVTLCPSFFFFTIYGPRRLLKHNLF